MSVGNMSMHGSSINFLSSGQMASRAQQLTRMPASVLKDAEKAAEELVSLLANVAEEDPDAVAQVKSAQSSRPQLTAPRKLASAERNTASNEEARADSDNNRHLLWATLMSVLENGNLKKLAFNAHSAATRDAALNASKEQLSSDYDAACNAVTEALNELHASVEQLEDVEGKVSVLNGKLMEAEAALSMLPEDSLGYKEGLLALDIMRAELRVAKNELAGLRGKVLAGERNVENLQGAVDELMEKSNGLDMLLSRSAIQEDQSNIARMLMLMTKLGEMMLKTGETRGETQRALLKLQEEMRLKKLIKDAEKADKELQKAEAMNKAMGCVGKILGAVITAVAVIGAVFTGGASLLLAGIGLALMLADEVYKGVTGNSFMEQAMKPIMKLLQPILQFVMEKVAGAMESFGVDAQTAKMAAMIAVSVVIAAAVVALAVTGVGGAIASAAANVLSKLGSVLSKVLEKTIAKLVPEMLKKSIAKMAQNVSSGASKLFNAASQRLGLSSDPISRQIYGQNMARLAAGANLARTSTTSGLDVGVQVANLQVAKAVASMRFTMSELDLLNDMFSNMLEQFQKSFSASQGFFARASEVITRHTNTGTAVARAIHGVRTA